MEINRWMKHILTYKLFEGAESPGTLKKYDEKAFQSHFGANKKPSPGLLAWVNGIFSGLENRFKEFESKYNRDIMKTPSGVPLDMGYGWLVGTAGQVASNIGKRLTKPGEPNNLSKDPKESSRIVHQTLFDDKGVPVDLGGDHQKRIDYINKNIYQKMGIRPGENPYVDQEIGSYFYDTVSRNAKPGDLGKLDSILASQGEAGIARAASSLAASGGTAAASAEAGGLLRMAPFLFL
jgi:hypothetical protein